MRMPKYMRVTLTLVYFGAPPTLAIAGVDEDAKVDEFSLPKHRRIGTIIHSKLRER